ncbi:MAG: Uma2 family endonuclease [Planctomycetaceae bacterium]
MSAATLAPPIKPSRPVAITVGPELAGVRMSAEEFDSITNYDDDFHYELIDGVLIVSPIASPQERNPNDELGFLLRWYRHEHPLGKSLDRTLPEEHVRIGAKRRRADRVIWAGLGRKPNAKKDTQTIVVEMVSAGRRNWQRDYVEKRDEYLGVGVKEYWVFDRFQRTLTIFRQTNTAIVEEVLQENESYRPALLPGFELKVADLLACAEE